MPRLNKDRKSLRAVLSYLTNTDVSDAEIARALDIAATTHQTRKHADDYPDFAELATIATHFGLSARVLQIAFGWRGEDELTLLNDEEMDQYIQQGGGISPLVGNHNPKAVAAIFRSPHDRHRDPPARKADPSKPSM
jgi:hypothetical protein